MQRQYNLRNPAVKRLMKEAQELREPTEQYHAQPLEDNLFEWHFTIRGPADSEFEEGLYHGRIILPPEYPMKPPSIILLTPNGRFDTNKKICLSISGYHPESWQPCWSIRTALLAIIGFMPTHGAGAIGSLDYSAQERKDLAKRSQVWKCASCGDISKVLAEVTEASDETNKKAKELASQISFQAEKEKKNTGTGAAISNDQVSTQGAGEPENTTPTESTPVGSINGAPQTVLPTPPATVETFSPFSPVPMWQPPVTNSGGSTFGPSFPLPFVSPTYPPGYCSQYFMPGNLPFFNPGMTPAPNVPVNSTTAASHLNSCVTTTEPITSASNNTTQLPGNLITAQSVTSGSTAQSPLTGSTAQSPLTGSTAQSPLTGSTAQSPLTESTAQSPLTGSTAQSPLTGSTAQSPLTGSTAQSPLTGSTSELSTSGSTGQSLATNNATIQSETITTPIASVPVTNSTVRQRQQQQQNAQPESTGGAVPVSSLPQQSRELREKNFSVVVIIVIITAILLLVIRRLCMMQ